MTWKEYEGGILRRVHVIAGDNPGILDVGCGLKPSGHVNTDIAAGENWEVRRDGTPVFMDPRTIRNFVVASGEFLPFQDNIFDEVVSRHVIEHTGNPSRFLRECLRVSSRKTTIVTPHRYGPEAWRNIPYHKHVFSSRSWSRTPFSERFISKYREIPSPFVPLVRIPKEWTIIFYKRSAICEADMRMILR